MATILDPNSVSGQSDAVGVGITEQELESLYEWLDTIPLSKPKKCLARDFADGVLAAELLHKYFPKKVELHNYSSANSTTQKVYNWNTLNLKVLKWLGMTLSKVEIEAISMAKPGAVEPVLLRLRTELLKKKSESDKKHSVSTDSPMAKDSNASSSSPRVDVSLSLEQLEAQIQEKDQIILQLQQQMQALEARVSKLEQNSIPASSGQPTVARLPVKAVRR